MNGGPLKRGGLCEITSRVRIRARRAVGLLHTPSTRRVVVVVVVEVLYIFKRLRMTPGREADLIIHCLGAACAELNSVFVSLCACS